MNLESTLIGAIAAGLFVVGHVIEAALHAWRDRHARHAGPCAAAEAASEPLQTMRRETLLQTPCSEERERPSTGP